MDGRAECLRMLRDCRAERVVRGGKIHWKLPTGDTLVTCMENHGDPRGWLNNVSLVKKFLGIKKNGAQKGASIRAERRRKRPIATVQKFTFEELVPAPKTIQQKVISAVGVQNIPRLAAAAEAFQPKVYAVEPEQPPAPVAAVWKPTMWKLPQVTPAMKESAFDKWSGDPWTDEQVVFADRVYFICGAEQFHKYLAIRRGPNPVKEQTMSVLQELKRQLSQIDAAIVARERLIQQAKSAEVEIKQLGESKAQVELTIEQVGKTEKLVSAGNGFELLPGKRAENGARKGIKQRAAYLPDALLYINNQSRASLAEVFSEVNKKHPTLTREALYHGLMGAVKRGQLAMDKIAPPSGTGRDINIWRKINQGQAAASA